MSAGTRRVLILVGWVALAHALQTGVLAVWRPWGLVPDLGLWVALGYGLAFGRVEGFRAGALAGLLHDFSIGQHLGVALVAKAALGWLAGFLEGRVFKENLAVLFLVGAAMGAGFELVYGTGLRLAGVPVTLAATWRQVLGLAALSSGAGLVLTYRLILGSRQAEARRARAQAM